MGSNDVIVPDAQVQVNITVNETLSDKIQKKEIYSKTAVTKAAQPAEKESLQKDSAGSWTGLSAYYFLLTFKNEYKQKSFFLLP